MSNNKLGLARSYRTARRLLSDFIGAGWVALLGCTMVGAKSWERNLRSQAFARPAVSHGSCAKNIFGKHPRRKERFKPFS